MAKINAADLVNFYDFGLNANRASANTTYRMYYDQTNEFLNFVSASFDIVASYTGYLGSDIVGSKKITKSDICVWNDEGVNARPSNGNRILRMYFAQRSISIAVGGGLPLVADNSLLIVDQDFTIIHIIPLTVATPPFTLPNNAIAVSYDYGLNAEAANENYIWHMYIGTIENRGEVLNTLLIVNQDFEVVSYVEPI